MINTAGIHRLSIYNAEGIGFAYMTRSYIYVFVLHLKHILLIIMCARAFCQTTHSQTMSLSFQWQIGTLFSMLNFGMC